MSFVWFPWFLRFEMSIVASVDMLELLQSDVHRTSRSGS